MRYSVIYFMLFFISFVLNAMQPQEPVKRMEISPQELAQEASKNKESYLSVLPAELITMVAAYNLEDFEKLDFAIASKKASVEKNETEKHKLLHDKAYNQQLIDQLSQAYRIYPSEVAFMLNTPASLEILKNMQMDFKEQVYDYYYRWRENIETLKGFDLLWRHIKLYLSPLLGASSNAQREINKQTAMKYLKRFVKRDQFRDAWVMFIDSIAQGFKQFDTRVDGNEDTGVVARNALIVSDYIEIAMELNGNGSLHLVIQKLKNTKWPYEMTKELYAKILVNLVDHLNHHDINKVNHLIYGLIINKAKIKDNLKFYFDYHTQYWKPATYQEFLTAVMNYIISTKEYALLNEIKELIPADDMTMLAHKLLFIAIKNKSLELLRIILGIPGINVNICQKGHNALWYARNLDTDAGTRLAIIELLQSAGATEEGVCAIQ